MSFKDRVKDFKSPKRIPIKIDGFPEGLFLEQRPYSETFAKAHEYANDEGELLTQIIAVSLVDESGNQEATTEEDVQELRDLPFPVRNALNHLVRRFYGIDEESQEQLKKNFDSVLKNGSGLCSPESD